MRRIPLSRPRQLQRWPNLDAAIRGPVEELLLAVWPDERQGPERAWWRAWIDTLPETGDDLRALAARERLPHRRARLRAIADVRDGLPAEVAAEIADVLPRTLYRWLKRGAAGGLGAALERPSGRLSEPQVIELAEWIAAASPDGPRWRSNRLQSEALRRFGSMSVFTSRNDCCASTVRGVDGRSSRRGGSALRRSTIKGTRVHDLRGRSLIYRPQSTLFGKLTLVRPAGRFFTVPETKVRFS